MEILQYQFINNNFKYSLFFQNYFRDVRCINNNVQHSEHQEYTAFFNAINNFVEKNKVVIDIGANSGLFCVPVCLYGYSVIAFEPVKSNLKCLELSIESNQLKNLTLSNYALSNENVKSEIFVPNSPDNASLIKEISFSNLQDKNVDVEEVECYRLDDYLFDNKIDVESIGLVKVDVQGFELKVIEGMKKLLKDTSELFLIIEWDKKHSGEYGLQKILDILREFNFIEVNYPGIVFDGVSGNKIYKKI